MTSKFAIPLRLRTATASKPDGLTSAPEATETAPTIGAKAIIQKRSAIYAKDFLPDPKWQKLMDDNVETTEEDMVDHGTIEGGVSVPEDVRMESVEEAADKSSVKDGETTESGGSAAEDDGTIDSGVETEDEGVMSDEATESEEEEDDDAVILGPKTLKQTQDDALYYGSAKKAAANAQIKFATALIDSFHEAKAKLLSVCTNIDENIVTLKGYLISARGARRQATDGELYDGYMALGQLMPELAFHATSAVDIADKMKEDNYM